MNRLIRILVYIIFFVLIFFWFSGIMKSCNQKKEANQQGPAVEENVQAVEDGVEDIVSEFFEDESAGIDQSANQESEEFEGDKENQKPATEKTEKPKKEPIKQEEKPASEKNEIKEKPVKKEPITPSTQSSEGPYMVIAGSFSVEENAEKMVLKLKNLGYYKATKIVFDESKFYSVTADRFSSRSDAQRIASELKSKGVDCYVHKAQ